MRRPPILKIFVTASALSVAVLHQWMPIEPDQVTLVLLAIAIVPWLQPFVKSVELLGLKFELHELQEQVATATGAAESAKHEAFLAQSVNAQHHQSSTAKPDSLENLAALYDQIRNTQPAGDARTRAMTGIVNSVIAVAPERRDFDMATALKSSDRGRRLVAYALLYAHPDPDLLGMLVSSVTALEDKPFGQYWGLRAISRVLDVLPDPHALAPTIVSQIAQFASRVPRATDRGYEVRQILERLKGVPNERKD